MSVCLFAFEGEGDGGLREGSLGIVLLNSACNKGGKLEGCRGIWGYLPGRRVRVSQLPLIYFAASEKREMTAKHKQYKSRDTKGARVS